MVQKQGVGTANSVDPDQTAPNSLSGSALFAKTYLSENNGRSLRLNIRVSRSLKKGQGGIQKKGTWCALSHSKRAHSVRVCTMRKRQKGYFQYNVEKH